MFSPFGLKRKTKKNIQAIVVLGILFGVPLMLTIFGLIVVGILRLFGIEPGQ